jgi:hypothetical protein
MDRVIDLVGIELEMEKRGEMHDRCARTKKAGLVHHGLSLTQPQPLPRLSSILQHSGCLIDSTMR